MSHKHIQAVSNVYQDVAKMVRFRLNKGWDYVWITYQEEKGFITVTSSYGNWSFIWSAMGEGYVLSTFFAKAGNDYIANKFWPTNTDQFDVDTAMKAIRKGIIEERLDGTLEKDEAREIWEAAEELEHNYDSNYNENRDRFIEAFMENEALSEWCQEPWEKSWGMSPKSSYLVMKNEIIPMIQAYFRGELKEEPEAPALEA